MLSTIRNFLRSLDRSPLAWPIAIAGALIFALMLPAAMGLTYGDHTLREFWDWKNILFVILTLFTLSQWKISRWFIAIPLVLIFGCYLPAGILYGKPSISDEYALAAFCRGDRFYFCRTCRYPFLRPGEDSEENRFRHGACRVRDCLVRVLWKRKDLRSDPDRVLLPQFRNHYVVLG